VENSDQPEICFPSFRKTRTTRASMRTEMTGQTTRDTVSKAKLRYW